MKSGLLNVTMKNTAWKPVIVESTRAIATTRILRAPSHSPGPFGRGSSPTIDKLIPMLEPIQLSGLSTLFQLITDGVLVWNSEEQIIGASSSIERTLGYPPDGLIGLTVANIVGPIVQGVARVQTWQGESMVCTVELRPMEYQGGTLTMALLHPRHVAVNPGSFTSRGMSRQVVELVTDVIFQVDTAGNWVFANQAWTALTGWSLAETLHHSFYKTIVEADVPAVQTCMQELLQGTRQEARISVRLITANKTLKWVEFALRVASMGRRIEGVAGTITDITIKREFEEELRTAAKRAESALTTKDMFLANMSHEIRTPMNAVIALTGLLLETSLNDEQRDFVETIRGSGDTLLTLINEILDFSKVESEQFCLEEAEFSVAQVLESALELVATSPKALQVELMLRIEPSVPKNMLGDACRLRQVLVNLAANAIKFTEHGHVLVAASTREVNGVTMLHVDVSDTGIGIPAHRAAQLFTPFTQVDASTTRQYGGTGLGLAISRRLIKCMHGILEFTSRVGEGTTFFFEVPLPSGNVTQSSAVPALAGRSARVVHPYTPGAEHIAAMLQQAGCSLRNYGADVLVVDESAPNLEALLCQSAMPTVLMASKARRSVWHRVVAKAKLYGNNVVIVSKPVRAAQLLSAVASWSATAEQSEAPQDGSGVIAQPLDLSALRVLVAEDNVVNQKVAIALLSKYGCKPDVVSNGVEALVALEQKHYDVVFLDVQMPEMDGLEAARRIVAKYPLVTTRPVLIAMTANVSPADRAECIVAGCELYVAKPVKVSELKLALQTAQQRISKRALPPRPAAPNARLAELALDVGDELVMQVVKHFIDDAPQRIERIDRAVHSMSMIELSRAAHGLRSSALNMGLRELADACLRLEKAPSSATGAMLLDALARVHAFLRIELDTLQSFVTQSELATPAS